MKTLILASTSRYRGQLLSQLGLAFTQKAPVCDETPVEGESIETMVRRLSAEKAYSLVEKNPDSLIIGSDQVADLSGEMFGKPETPERAIEQLKAVSGRSVVFRTGLCLIATPPGDQPKTLFGADRALRDWLTVVNVTVRFRTLSEAEITRYVEQFQPLDCACSFRSEGGGLALLASLETNDPSALIGLPLIQLSNFLRAAGVQVP